MPERTVLSLHYMSAFCFVLKGIIIVIPCTRFWEIWVTRVNLAKICVFWLDLKVEWWDASSKNDLGSRGVRFEPESFEACYIYNTTGIPIHGSCVGCVISEKNLLITTWQHLVGKIEGAASLVSWGDQKLDCSITLEGKILSYMEVRDLNQCPRSYWIFEVRINFHFKIADSKSWWGVRCGGGVTIWGGPINSIGVEFAQLVVRIPMSDPWENPKLVVETTIGPWGRVWNLVIDNSQVNWIGWAKWLVLQVCLGHSCRACDYALEVIAHWWWRLPLCVRLVIPV